MFDNPRHRDVLTVLRALDAELLAAAGFLFGGGTRVVLDLAEFRESLDIDFLCSDTAGYGELRWRVRRQGHSALFPAGAEGGIGFPRETRVDQYGIRFPVTVGGNVIKIELIREGRVELAPGMRPGWAPVDCLAISDCYAVKLLANSDRWADRQALARDLIDLAALRQTYGPIPPESWSKAETAYKAAVREDLAKALAQFTANPEFRHRCFEGLRVTEPETVLVGISLLAEDLGSEL